MTQERDWIDWRVRVLRWNIVFQVQRRTRDNGIEHLAACLTWVRRPGPDDDIIPEETP